MARVVARIVARIVERIVVVVGFFGYEEEAAVLNDDLLCCTLSFEKCDSPGQPGRLNGTVRSRICAGFSKELDGQANLASRGR